MNTVESSDPPPPSDEALRLLRSGIDAMGGTAAVDKLRGPIRWKERGAYHGRDVARPFECEYQAHWPGHYRQEIAGVYTFTVSGDQAWTMSPAGNEDLSGEVLSEAIQGVRVHWAQRLFPLTASEYRLSVEPGIPVDGRETLGLRASHSAHRDVVLYFDRATYLLAKVTTRTVSLHTGAEPIDSEYYYSDYRPFGGVLMPTKCRLLYSGALVLEAETIDFHVDADLDPDHFTKPELDP